MIAEFISLLLTVPFPLFATYKALKDPTIDALAPLLTFYAVLSVLHLLEGTVLLPFTYLPLYSWARLAAHVYLCLPPPQGAVAVYNAHIHPFLSRHESDIEDGVARLHDRARAATVTYARHAADWFRVHVLGAEPLPPPPPAPPSYYGSYAQQLLARFYSTSSTGAAPGAAAPPPAPAAASDLYSTLLSTLRLSGAGSAAGLGGHAAAQNLIPRDISSPADRLRYARQAQDGLRTLMAAFAKEEGGLLGEADGGGGLTKTRSEADFDRIERDEASPDRSKTRAAAGGGWMPWTWSAGQAAPEGKRDEDKRDEGPAAEGPAVGRSSGVESGAEDELKRR